ncbi:hypothetical protein RHODGE_RHODGE_04102 [Rhodoplanes serenus]|uniref:General secretion pathway GspH domain-containing protein n=1 Tax=Rhodoplanes serenus TaxID=200615 RepID=A0A3S4FBP5_9BRAD|nr:type II secretion system protein GspH [Rhodoplanes serenus]VCU10503.1 hypothetical protein RHODGE_RHODGE_04102 [Rhodoplanes serenus]
MVALLAALVLPALPRGTSRARLEAYAVETAALLKADRAAAIRRRIAVATHVDAEARLVSSPVTGRTVRLPADVDVQAILAARCNQQRTERSIHFFPSGVSCGGAITLRRAGQSYRVRVDWLTGGIDVAPLRSL